MVAKTTKKKPGRPKKAETPEQPVFTIDQIREVLDAIESEKQPDNEPPVTETAVEVASGKYYAAIDLQGPIFITQRFIEDKPPANTVWEKRGGGRGARKLVVTNDSEPIDLYLRIERTQQTPAMFFNQHVKPALQALLAGSPNLWSRIQTGAYITVLIVLGLVVGLIILVLLGD